MRSGLRILGRQARSTPLGGGPVGGHLTQMPRPIERQEDLAQEALIAGRLAPRLEDRHRVRRDGAAQDVIRRGIRWGDGEGQRGSCGPGQVTLDRRRTARQGQLDRAGDVLAALAERHVPQQIACRDGADHARDHGSGGLAVEQQHPGALGTELRPQGRERSIQLRRITSPLAPALGSAGLEHRIEREGHRGVQAQRQRCREVCEGEVLRRPMDGWLREHETDTPVPPVHDRQLVVGRQQRPLTHHDVGRALTERREVRPEARLEGAVSADLEPLDEATDGPVPVLEQQPRVPFAPLPVPDRP